MSARPILILLISFSWFFPAFGQTVPLPMPRGTTAPAPAATGPAPMLTQTLADAPPPRLTQSLPPVIPMETPGYSAIGAPDPMFWIRTEYFFGWTSPTHLPVLATTSPPGTSIADAGILGRAQTSSIFSPTANDRIRNGVRAAAGTWFEGYRRLGAELGVSILEGQRTGFYADSDRLPIIGRPFFNTDNNLPQAILVAFPGTSLGSLDIKSTSGYLLDTHFDIMERGLDTGRLRVNALLGYRYFFHTDTLHILQNQFPQGGAFVTGTRIISSDFFEARNSYHGMELGLRGELNGDTLSLEFLVKLAYGRLYTTTRVEGIQVVQVPGADTSIRNGAAFALISNSGVRNSSHGAILPEFGLKLKRRLYDTMQVQVGYNILMLQGLVRAPDLIDTNISASNFPPVGTVGPNPQPRLFHRDVWVQALTFGITMQY